MCSYYILAGGQSSRFGSDKAIAEVDGRPLALHAADRFAPYCDDVTIVSDGRREYSRFGLRTIHDAFPDHGPCAGVSVALHDATTEWIFVSPCDLTGVPPDVMNAFVGQEGPVVAFRVDGKWQPLFAAYHRDVARTMSEAAKKEDALWRVLEAVGATEISVPTGWSSVEAWDYRL